MREEPSEGPSHPLPLRKRLIVIGSAALISVSAGAFAWQAFVPSQGPGDRGARDTLPPLDRSTIPRDEDGIPTVLALRCDAEGMEILTPTVVAQPDGLHVRAYVTGLHDPEIRLRSERPGSPSYWSGSSGVRSEFVRSVSPGRASVHCEEGPGQGDGPQDFEAVFDIVAPGRGFVENGLDCADGVDISLEHQVHAPSAADAVRAAVNGLQPDDAVQDAGYQRGQQGQSGYVRVVRLGAVVGSFDVAPFGGKIWYVHRAEACPGSGLSMADPSWVTIWSSSETDRPPEGVDGYVVSGVVLRMQPDVPSDAVVVDYHLEWNTDDDPGARDCVTTVFDASGAVIARRTVSEQVPAGTDSGFLIVVDGEAATASVTCEP